MNDVDFLALVFNGVFTCFCGSIIAYSITIKRLKKHTIYYAWSLGFFLYGVQMIIRALSLFDWMQTTLMSLAFIFFLAGIWSLDRRKKSLFIIILIYSSMVIILLLYHLAIIDVTTLIIFGSNLLFLPVTIYIMYHRFLFGKIVDKLAFGWLLLYLVNVTLWGKGWIIDFFAIFAKFVLLLGIMDYEFIILAEKVRRERISRTLPIDTGAEKEGGLKIIISSSVQKIDWMSKTVYDNVRNNVDTYVFSFQDVNPHHELRRVKWIDPDKVSIFLFSTSSEKANKEFVVLPMGITEIGATFSEVIKKYSKAHKGCTIIFSDLSLLVHVFGIYPVYRMLLNKMGALRESGVNLFSFFHPETHSDKSVVSLLINIADEVIKL